jgi:FAD/FMN-containing dehydrogenase
MDAAVDRSSQEQEQVQVQVQVVAAAAAALASVVVEEEVVVVVVVAVAYLDATPAAADKARPSAVQSAQYASTQMGVLHPRHCRTPSYHQTSR